MTFEQEMLLALAKVVFPVLALLFGSQWLLDRYAIARKKRDEAIELVRFVRQQQYLALEEVYSVFAGLMELYRIMNYPATAVADPATHDALLVRACALESRVDALVLRVASEFEHSEPAKVEANLAHLRQSAQLWRESLHRGERLPFAHSEQADYRRFKDAFAATAAYVAASIYGMEPGTVELEKAQQMLGSVFSNRWEQHGRHLPTDKESGS